MQEVVKRNFEAMSQGLKSQREEIALLKSENKVKDNRISMLENRIMGIEQRLAVVFAKSMGNGATQWV